MLTYNRVGKKLCIVGQKTKKSFKNCLETNHALKLINKVSFLDKSDIRVDQFRDVLFLYGIICALK